MTLSLNLVFAGTPSFAVSTLDKLIDAGFRVSVVVTQPDRPRGRGMELTASPIKQRALQLDLPITQPEKIRENQDFRAQLAAIQPDAIVVVGYGRILPPWMIDLPPLGNINLHASLLPQYRGAAPIQWAIASGESVTGVTTMRIDRGLDTGDILLQQAVSIAAEETAESLSPRLAGIGAELMIKTLHGLKAGSVHPRPQDHSQATLAPTLKKEDGRIDFTRSAREILNRLRGFQPWPGAFTRFHGKNLHIWQAKPIESEIPPGELRSDHETLLIGCGDGSALELLVVQPEGKRRIAARDFLHGHRFDQGERLG
jgi:methionyl-tRNA formyltransferase